MALSSDRYGLSRAASNFTNAYMMGKQVAAEREAKAEKNRQNQMLGQMLMGQSTPQQQQQLAQSNPSAYLQAQNYLQQQQSARQKQQDVMNQEEDEQSLLFMLSADGDSDAIDQHLSERISTIESRGGDASHTRRILSMKPDQRNKYLQLTAQQVGIELPSKTEFEQGDGEMSGYAFNPDTGEYTIDESTAMQLQADAASKAKDEGMLRGKDLASVNDKVTSLVTGSTDIVESAKSLEALQERGTPAAQLAAVFKFMKANDPSSTVREGEQGMVYAAEGPMKAFAAKLNQLMGSGGLSKTNFADLVDTAKAIANSSVASTDDAVNLYLNVLSDNIDTEAYDKMLNRVPKAFEDSATTNEPEKPLESASQAMSLDEARNILEGL